MAVDDRCESSYSPRNCSASFDHSTFAARASMELERLRATTEIAGLNEKLQRAADRARTLLAINNAVVLNLTRDALFQAIVTALRPVIRFDRSTIFLYDEQRKILRLVAAESEVPSSHFVPGFELGLDNSHAGWTFLHQRPFFRPDLAKERKYPGEDVLFHEGFRSLIVVPLIVRGKSIGTLNLGSAALRKKPPSTVNSMVRTPKRVVVLSTTLPPEEISVKVRRASAAS